MKQKTNWDAVIPHRIAAECSPRHVQSVIENAVSDIRELTRQRDELLSALEMMNRAYVNLMENGRDRIIMLGGDCDPVDVMERNDPNLRDSRSAIASVKGGTA